MLPTTLGNKPINPFSEMRGGCVEVLTSEEQVKNLLLTYKKDILICLY
jgi:hypothetical protein